MHLIVSRTATGTRKFFVFAARLTLVRESFPKRAFAESNSRAASNGGPVLPHAASDELSPALTTADLFRTPPTAKASHSGGNNGYESK